MSNKKQPLSYNNKIVGYVDSIEYQEDVINTIKIFLFDTEYIEEIKTNIKKSNISKIDNIEFDYLLYEDILILTNKKQIKI